MKKEVINTNKAPQPMGCYSQAIRAGSTLYLAGQIAIDPQTGNLIDGDFQAQVHRVFKNLQAVTEAASGSLDSIVKLTVFLTDISKLSIVNEIMGSYFQKPYPARTSIAVAALPQNVPIEIEAIMTVG